VSRVSCNSSRSVYGIGRPWFVRLTAYASRAVRSSARAIDAELLTGERRWRASSVRAFTTWFHKNKDSPGRCVAADWFGADNCAPSADVQASPVGDSPTPMPAVYAAAHPQYPWPRGSILKLQNAHQRPSDAAERQPPGPRRPWTALWYSHRLQVYVPLEVGLPASGRAEAGRKQGVITAGKFEIYPSGSQWRFRLKSRNGEIVATGAKVVEVEK
jgi:hypothetical protein